MLHGKLIKFQIISARYVQTFSAWPRLLSGWESLDYSPSCEIPISSFFSTSIRHHAPFRLEEFRGRSKRAFLAPWDNWALWARPWCNGPRFAPIDKAKGDAVEARRKGRKEDQAPKCAFREVGRRTALGAGPFLPWLIALPRPQRSFSLTSGLPLSSWPSQRLSPR